MPEPVQLDEYDYTHCRPCARHGERRKAVLIQGFADTPVCEWHATHPYGQVAPVESVQVLAASPGRAPARPLVAEAAAAIEELNEIVHGEFCSGEPIGDCERCAPFAALASRLRQ